MESASVSCAATESNPPVEEWRAVPGYEGYYEVSNLGRVRSLNRVIRLRDGRPKTLKGIIMKPWFSGGQGEHPCVAISKEDKVLTAGIYRLVYMAFIGHIPDGMEVDHKDRDRSNNCYDNLRLATRSQNAANSTKKRTNTSGYKGVSKSKSKVKTRWYAGIEVMGKYHYLGTFDTPQEASAAYRAAAIQHFGSFACLD